MCLPSLSRSWIILAARTGTVLTRTESRKFNWRKLSQKNEILHSFTWKILIHILHFFSRRGRVEKIFEINCWRGASSSFGRERVSSGSIDMFHTSRDEVLTGRFTRLMKIELRVCIEDILMIRASSPIILECSSTSSLLCWVSRNIIRVFNFEKLITFPHIRSLTTFPSFFFKLVKRRRSYDPGSWIQSHDEIKNTKNNEFKYECGLIWEEASSSPSTINNNREQQTATHEVMDRRFVNVALLLAHSVMSRPSSTDDHHHPTRLAEYKRRLKSYLIKINKSTMSLAECVVCLSLRNIFFHIFSSQRALWVSASSFIIILPCCCSSDN